MNTTENPTSAPKDKLFPLVATFGITHNLLGEEIDPKLSLKGFDQHPDAPAVIPYYRFNTETFTHGAFFLMNPGKGILFLSGPQGCGKSSLMEQICARLNWPVTRVAAHEKMHVDDLIIRWIPDGQGGLKPVDGLLTKAFREGHVTIIDEVDSLPPGELITFNGLRDKGRLVVPATGEVINRHPNFRLVFTGNSNGAGDQTGLYAGIKRQNAASFDGTRCILVGYPPPEVEEEILEAVAPALGKKAQLDILQKMVSLAGKLRQAFTAAGGELAVSIPLSTRSLVDWAELTLQYKKSPAPLAIALDLAYANRLDEDERMAVHEAAKLTFDHHWQ